MHIFTTFEMLLLVSVVYCVFRYREIVNIDFRRPRLHSFSLIADKGQTLCIDLEPYVDSCLPWQLVAVTDPMGLVIDIEISGSQLVMTADYPGLTELQWQIEQDEKSYSSTALLVVQE